MYLDEIEYVSLMVFCFNRYGRHDVNKFDLVLYLVTRVKNVSTRERERERKALVVVLVFDVYSNCRKVLTMTERQSSSVIKKIETGHWSPLGPSLRVFIGTHSSRYSFAI